MSQKQLPSTFLKVENMKDQKFGGSASLSLPISDLSQILAANEKDLAFYVDLPIEEDVKD